MENFLLSTLGELPQVNEMLIQKDPLFAMLILILNNSSAEDHRRDSAADAYIAQYPEDVRFERAYVYLKTPQILLSHLLISANQWTCANPENTAFYDEQIAGVFQGTIAFDKGDYITREELAAIQHKEGENPRFPMINSLEEAGDNFVVKKWCCSPVMCSTNSRIDDLFIPSRRVFQEQVSESFVERLAHTSKIVQRVYSLPADKTAVVAVIGPYGAGKSEFVKQKFAQEKEAVTVYSLDKFNEKLKTPLSRAQDHHFEAMMLTTQLMKKLANVPVLLTETAAIDEFRFSRLVNRDFATRELIVIEEIAPENPVDSVNRFINRELVSQDEHAQLTNLSRMGAVKTSSEDALRFRSGRIQTAVTNPKVEYTLYCSQINPNCYAIFIETAKAKSGKTVISEGKEEIFNQLTSEQKV